MNNTKKWRDFPCVCDDICRSLTGRWKAIASVHLHRIFTVMLPQLRVSSRKPLIGPVKVMASRKWNILLSLIVASVCAGDQTLTPVEVEQLPFS